MYLVPEKNWFNQKSIPVRDNRHLPNPRPATCMLCLIPKTNPSYTYKYIVFD